MVRYLTGIILFSPLWTVVIQVKNLVSIDIPLLMINEIIITKMKINKKFLILLNKYPLFIVHNLMNKVHFLFVFFQSKKPAPDKISGTGFKN